MGFMNWLMKGVGFENEDVYDDTMERDKQREEKLRRKEAKVAKQKVMLYGVNNFVDIDEEKAKELNEELDLLEGLRLSVKHCEDVMNANKDRFPILEQTNKILTNAVQEIKSDIADVKAKIDMFNAESAEADTATEENN